MSNLKAFQAAKPDATWGEHWVALHKLLQPIKWSWSSGITSRQNLVFDRHRQVRLVKPFTTGSARKLVSSWLATEGHDGLWD